MLSISDITVLDLQSGKYLEVLPEVYALRGVTENNSWHHRQDAFDHIVTVFGALRQVFEMDFVQGHTWQAYLDEVIGTRPRRELLQIAALLHDIGKKPTWKANPDNTTGCPNHEVESANMVGNCAERFGLGEAELTYVTAAVRWHLAPYTALTEIEEGDNDEMRLLDLACETGDVYHDVLLLHIADMLGSDVLEDQYRFRLSLIDGEFGCN